MSKCSLDDPKIEAILGNVQLININELILGKNTKISSVGWSNVNKAINQSICLNRLDLLDCAINDEKLGAIFNHTKFDNMKELNLRENKDITYNGINIVENCLAGKISDIVIM